jgi:16S rRNA (adenine1518-N6/adenine1519-N6)-dimethyltransferase
MKTSADRRPSTYPKKRLGQHFLVDRNIVEKILNVAGIRQGEHILEVGPGLGALTGALLEAGVSVTAIELDRALTETLLERFKGKPFTCLGRDALKVSFTELSRREGIKFKVVSNLPYNISGPILVKFIEERAAFTALFLMLQKEVASRLVAVPGTKDYGVLSVLAQTYTRARREFDVQPASFSPRPKVISTVVSLNILERPGVSVHDEKFFKAVVKSAFARRRKTLLNSLKTLGMPAPELKGVLQSLGLDPKRRGETLTLEEFSALAGALSGQVDRESGSSMSLEP